MKERLKNPEVYKRRRTTAKWILGILMSVVALIVLPIPLGEIKVGGSQVIDKDDVVNIGGLSYPVNVLQVRTSNLEERLEKDLRIESAKVSYDFPITLRVQLVDRKPVIVVPSQFGYVGVDKRGQVIESGPAITNTSIPIISGIKLGNVLLGDTLQDESVKWAITYVESMSEEGKQEIAEINLGDSNQMVAYTIKGLPIRIGDGTDLEQKARLTEDMVKDVKKRNVNAQYLDVNVKSPFIKVN